MKLLEHKNHTKVSDGLKTTKFKVQMSPKMAQILSKGIYSDYIKAVIRELSTNAYDSHIMAGKKNTPIEVTLPTTWSCNFIVQDFGVGISPEQIEEIYTIYGESNKEDDNSVTGCLGLGGKTIFCYGTKTASIENTYNGIKYSYSAYIGTDNMPALSELGQVPTTACNGVKITIPVNRTDIQNFANKAKEIYEFFDVKPIIRGTTLTFDKPQILVKGDGWELRESGYNAVAIMANVAYPVKWSESSLSSIDSKMMQHPFHIYFDTGDLDIEVSREGLGYDIKTKTNILAKFKDIRTKLDALFEAEIQSCKTLWDARLLAIGKSDVLYDYINKGKITWQGQKLFPSYFSHIALPAKIKYYDSYYSSRESFTPKECDNVNIKANNLYIRNDLDKGLDTRVHHKVVSSSSSYSYYDRPTVYVVSDDKEQDMLVKELGLDPALIILASTLPKPVPKPRVTGTGTKRGNTHSVMEFRPSEYGQTMSNYYTNVEKDFDDGGSYFEFNTFKCQYAGNSMHPRDVARIINALEACGKKQDTVYAIKTAKIAKLAKSAKPWKEYISSALTDLDGLYSSLQYTNLKEVEVTINKFGGYDYKIGYSRMSCEQIIELAKLTKKQDFKDFAKSLADLIEINKSNDTRKTIESLYNTIGRALPQATATPIDAAPLCKAVLDGYSTLNIAYPLLQHFTGYDSDLNKEIIVYINAR